MEHILTDNYAFITFEDFTDLKNNKPDVANELHKLVEDLDETSSLSYYSTLADYSKSDFYDTKDSLSFWANSIDFEKAAIERFDYSCARDCAVPLISGSVVCSDSEWSWTDIAYQNLNYLNAKKTIKPLTNGKITWSAFQSRLKQWSREGNYNCAIAANALAVLSAEYKQKLIDSLFLNNDKTYVISDTFNYAETEGIIPVSVTTSFEKAKEIAYERARKASQEVMDEGIFVSDLEIEEMDERECLLKHARYGFHITHADEGVLETIMVCELGN